MTFSSLPGAVTDGESGVVVHYGSVFAEQRALAAGGVVARQDLAVLALTGSERLSWLDTLTSQTLAHLRPGESAETLILDPHGHVEHALWIVDDGQTAWALVPVERAEAALGWLNRMRFRADVQIRDASSEWLPLAQYAHIPLDLSVHGWPVWRDPWPGVVAGGFGYASNVPDWDANIWLVPVAQLADLIAQLQAAEVSIAGVLAWQALRIAAGRPEATDADGRALPHELDWLRSAVHLNKGCYRGQETVAKVHNLGRPPRRLVLLHLDGSDSVLPEAGDTVCAAKDGEVREVGHVVAAAQHWELGPIALALVKRAMPVTHAVWVQHGETQIAASQQELVPADAGPALSIPRFPRMGIRP